MHEKKKIATAIRLSQLNLCAPHPQNGIIASLDNSILQSNINAGLPAYILAS